MIYLFSRIMHKAIACFIHCTKTERTNAMNKYVKKLKSRIPAVLLLLGCVVGGVLLLLTQSLQLLYVGLAGGLLTVLYSFLKYHSLGDVVILLNYAILPIMGTSLVTVGYIDWSAMVLVVPLGLITVSILHINNARDAVSDREAGIRTFAMRIGPKASAVIYKAEVLLPFVWVIFAVCFYATFYVFYCN